MTREELMYVFQDTLNEAVGTTEFEDVLNDIREVERFLNGDHQTTIDLENEE